MIIVASFKNKYAARNPDFMIYNENRRWTRTLPDGTTQSSLDQEEIPEGRIYAIKRSVFSVLPSVSYTRTF